MEAPIRGSALPIRGKVEPRNLVRVRTELMPPDDWFQFEADPLHVARERERARKLRGTAWWQRRLQRGICAYCSQPFPAKALTMDHVVPVARGGRSTKGNVVPSCKPCNSRKKLMTPAEQLLFAERVARAEDDESADDQ